MMNFLDLGIVQYLELSARQTRPDWTILIAEWL
jgi:hypothetical protein